MNGSLERAKAKQESKVIVRLPLLVVGSDGEEDYVIFGLPLTSPGHLK